MYMDPEASKEIPIDRQILRRRILVVALIPEKVITHMEKKPQPRMSLKNLLQWCQYTFRRSLVRVSSVILLLL